MAELSRLLGRTVYLDTNIFVYAVEGYGPERDTIREVFGASDRRAFAAVTSEFTLAGLLVRPFALGRGDAVSDYTDLVRPSGRPTVAPVDRPVLIEAARQRAGSGILMPDAIHAATAVTTGCDFFLTNDRRLKPPPSVVLELL